MKLFKNVSDETIIKWTETLKIGLPERLEGQELAPGETVLDVIMKFWPVFKPILKAAKLFTGNLVDALIDALIYFGDNYTNQGHE